MRLELAKRKTLKFIDNLNKSKRGVRIRNAHFKLNNMKKLVNYFTPRNADERNALGGLFVGIVIITLIIILIP